MTYRLTKAAENDVINIYIDGASRFGVHQADLYHDGLEATFTMLANYPKSGKEIRNIKPPVRIFVFQAHLIIYSEAKNHIMILRILHGRQDWLQYLN